MRQKAYRLVTQGMRSDYRYVYNLANYDITPTQWRKMFKRQAGRCPICQNPIHPRGNPLGKRAASVDHDHKTKRVRGLVCHVCNRTKIGTNTAETAQRVLDYLTSGFDGRNI